MYNNTASPLDDAYRSVFVIGECIWLDLSLINSVLDDCRALFPVSGYASITIPTYPCGQIGMVMASLNQVRARTIIMCSYFMCKLVVDMQQIWTMS